MEGWSTVRVVVRGLARRPGLSWAAVVTLALGVGANVGLFSVVDSVLRGPLPFPDAHELVQLWESDPRRATRAFSPADYLDLRAQAGSLAEVAAWLTSTRTLSDAEPARRVQAASVSGNFFLALGVEAASGRTFGPEAAEVGEHRAVLSHRLWRGAFGGAPDVVGRSLLLDGEAYTVVGVMPPSFRFPDETELWTAAPRDVPWSAYGGDADLTGVRNAWYIQVVARLAPGVEAAVAAAEVDDIAARLARSWPAANEGLGIRLVPLRDELVGPVRGRLLLLLGATGLILLVACVNVANLLLVRGAGRTRELALRRALGAGRGRIVGHVLSEGLVLALAGTALGVLGAGLGVELAGEALAAVLPPDITVALDRSVLAYGAALALAVALAFGAVPAWASAGVAPCRALAGGGRGEDAGDAATRAGSTLVAVEVALATLLVLGAVLALRSAAALHDVDPGFREEGLRVASVALPGGVGMPVDEARAFYREVGEAMAALPGVSRVGWSQRGPLELGPGAGLRRRDGGEASWTREDLPGVRWQVVDPGYFPSLGVPVLEGRGLRASDDHDSEPVGVVNQAFVRAVFGGESPVGRLVNTGLDGRDGGDGWRWVRVVGVVADTRNRGPAELPEPVLFRPLAQGGPGFPGDALLLAVRAEGPVPGLVPALRRAVERAAPGAPVWNVRAGSELAGPYLAASRLLLGMLGAFAVLALVLGAVGVYGVTAFAVGRRTRELGVRMALGAEPGRLLRGVLASSLAPVLVGLAAGLALALPGGRLLRSHLFGVEPWDPASWAAVGAVLVGASVVATLGPALRASRVDPREAMRAE